MITKLRAQNWKSWKDTGDITLARLTGLFGTNSSGKSSILQLLLMLKQTVESADRRRVLHTGGDERSYADLGTFQDLIHGHNTDLPLSFSLDWDLPSRLAIANPEQKGSHLFEIDALTFSASIVPDVAEMAVNEFSYNFDSVRFGMARKTNGVTERRELYELIHDGYVAKRTVGRGWPLPAPAKCYGFPDEAVGYYQNTGFLPRLALAFEQLQSSIAYLGPLRDYPQRRYVWVGAKPVGVGTRGEDTVAALLAARREGKRATHMRPINRLHETVDEFVLRWLRRMGLAHSFDVQPIAENRRDYEVRLATTPQSPDVLITDVGFGVSQILPVLVLCYYVPEGTTLLLEHPEIHLHPSVQAELADLLIDVVRARKVQVIVESHSEHLLRRLQRRIAEEAIAESDTGLYFCRTGSQGSEIEKLQVNLFGEISNWPQDFFGDEMGDLIAATEAAIRRQAGGQGLA